MTCSIEGCVKAVKARGWCGAHYQNWRTTGDPMPRKRPTYGQRLPVRGRNGYLRVWSPGHPLADGNGLVYEHRKVAWDAGLFTDASLHVHHKNEDRTDNRLENLEVIDQPTHQRRHLRERGYVRNQYGTWALRKLSEEAS